MRTGQVVSVLVVLGLAIIPAFSSISDGAEVIEADLGAWLDQVLAKIASGGMPKEVLSGRQGEFGTGTNLEPQAISGGMTLAEADWSYADGQYYSQLGSSVASAGDVNADGFGDVIVGASTWSNPDRYEGRALLFLGSPSGLSSAPSWTAEGNQVEAQFGYAVAGAGDVNGDGYDDVVIGAPFYTNGEQSEGRAFLYYGSPSGLQSSPAWTWEPNRATAVFGSSVTSAGDIKGTGFDGVAIGALGWDKTTQNPADDRGRAYVFYGSSSGLPSSPDWVATGDQASAYYGVSVSTAGDVNRDGYGDLVVGADEYTNDHADEGRAYLYLGASTGLGATPVWYKDGEGTGAWFGHSVASAGDVNDDGYGDVIIGAPRFTGDMIEEGLISVYLGVPSGLGATPSYQEQGDWPNSLFGWSVASAGDVNDDLYDDIIVGSPGYQPSINENLVFWGRARIRYGANGGIQGGINPPWEIHGEEVYQHLGCSVSSAGDVNGDRVSDIIVGAESDITWTRLAHVYAYYALVPLWADFTYEPMLPNVGQSVAFSATAHGGVGPYTYAWTFGDGGTGTGKTPTHTYASGGIFSIQLTITDSQSHTATRYKTITIQSPSGPWTAEGDQTSADFGFSVASAGDVNRDGYGDIIIGARFYTNDISQEGRAYLYLGSSQGPSTSPAWIGEGNQASAHYGWSVASAGDVNGDGYGDVIVGAPWFSNGQANEGRVFVYQGSPSGLLANPSWTAESNVAYANLGRAVASAGDVNGDGYSDVVVGTGYYTGRKSYEGAAFVYLGSASGLAVSPVWSATGGQANAQYGDAVAPAGDVNRDGYADLLVGAPAYDTTLTDAGRAYLYYGSSSGPKSRGAWITSGTQANAWYGVSVAGAGDVNRDGFADVIVGAPGFNNGLSQQGKVWAFYGSSAGIGTTAQWSIAGSQVIAQFGSAVAGAGDTDGDGYADVVIGAPFYSNGQTEEGVVFLFRGSPTGLLASPARMLECNQANAAFGSAVTSAGNVKKDATSDIIIGAHWYDNGQVDEGRVWVYM